MRCCRRNKKPFHYAMFAGKMLSPYCGEYELTYNEVKACMANISPASGDIVTEAFGTVDGYDRVIIVGDPAIEIDENSVLWIDREPDEETDSSKGVVCGDIRVKAYDYIVKSIARGLHEAVIGVTKVNVRE